MDLHRLSATELGHLFQQHQASPVEVVQAVLARIERLNGEYVAYCLVDAEGAMRAAAEAEKRWLHGTPLGALDGVPTSIKELQTTRDWPTTRSSRAPEWHMPPGHDAPAVASLRAVGAILLGQTTSPEIGWKGVTDSPRYGVTRNAWNPARTAGGSSGGAAVAAALGLGALHTGSDAGGSIRIPAAFNGVVGVKPSFGRVPIHPPSAFGLLSHVGPIARSVADCAAMLAVMMRPDPRDGTALPPLAGLSAEPADLKGLRIAYSPHFGGAQSSEDVLAAVARAVDLVREAGALVEEVGPVIESQLASFQTLWFTGCAASVSPLSERSLELLDPGLRQAALIGAEISGVELAEAHFARMKLMAAMAQFHTSHDLLITPAMPGTAFDADRQVADPAQFWWMEWTPFTYPFNMTGQPAASLPCGLDRDGLPIGIQIVAPAYQDAGLLQAAAAIEALLPKLPPPPAAHG